MTAATLSPAAILDRLEVDIHLATLVPTRPGGHRRERAQLRLRHDGTVLYSAEASTEDGARKAVMAEALRTLEEVTLGRGEPTDIITHDSHLSGATSEPTHVRFPEYAAILRRHVDGKPAKDDAQVLADLMIKLELHKGDVEADAAALRNRDAEAVRLAGLEKRIAELPTFDALAEQAEAVDAEIEKAIKPLEAKRAAIIHQQEQREGAENRYRMTEFTPTFEQIDRLRPALDIQRKATG